MTARLLIASVALSLLALACDLPPEPPPTTKIDANWNPVDGGVDATTGDVADHDGAELDAAGSDAAFDAGGEPDAARPDVASDDAARDDSAIADAGLADAAGDPDGSTADAAVAGDAAADADASADVDAAVGSDAGGTGCLGVTISYTIGTSATTVLVAGEFNGWADSVSGGAWAMRNDDSDGTWTVTRALAGGQYQFKFIVDGSWQHDPTQPTVVEGSNTNNLLTWAGCPDSCPAEFNWRDAVMYFAMVDRFHDSDDQADPVSGATDGDATSGPSAQYEGGDLAGVTAKIPYLDTLGVTALWLSTPYDNRDLAGDAMDPASDSNKYSAFHGYWPSPADIDYSSPDSPSPEPLVETRIGDSADLHGLVTAAHGTTGAGGNGIKVLFDYVMNHVDSESGLFQNQPGWFVPPYAGSEPENPGVDVGTTVLCQPTDLWNNWYWGTRCAFNPYLPALDFSVQGALDWSINDAIWWAKNYNIDGYRLDAIKHVPLGWLTALRSRVDIEFGNPAGGRFYMVGETFDYYDRDTLKAFVDPDTMLDGQFDFPFKRKLCEAVFSEAITMDAFSQWIGGNDGYYGRDAIMTTWIGNHDIPRVIHFASGQIGNCSEGSHAGNGWAPASFTQPTDAAPYQRLAVAYAVMFTNPGIPLIYYGDELGLAGGGDPDNRRMMPWVDDDLEQPQKDLRAVVARLGQIRADHPALSRGYRQWISSADDTWVYKMSGCGEDDEILVAINRADVIRTVDLPAGSYQDLIAEASQSGGLTTLGPRSFLVLQPQ